MWNINEIVMKRNLILGWVLMSVLASCARMDTKEYLRGVIEKMETIESVEYQCHVISWTPYEENPAFEVMRVCHEYANPVDTAFGASYVWFDPKDDMRIGGGYDGKVRMLVYPERKEIAIDDFSTNKLPFRQVGSFFNNVKSILRYAVETTDSITTSLVDEDSCWHYSLTIHEDKQVEFFGKAMYMPNEHLKRMGEDPTSHYEVWIRKSDNLPYKYYRKMSHDINSEECICPVYNQRSLADFNLYDYIPEDYEVRMYKDLKTKKQSENVYALQDKPAPQWTLTDTEERPYSLADVKSKVVLLNFTGVGCGACQVAIPFLKGLKEKYSSNKLELVAIESWTNRTSIRKAYAEKKELNYAFLGATEEVLNDYQTGRAAPWFFLLDENRIVRKIFYGYAEGRTDKEIEEALQTMLRK